MVKAWVLEAVIPANQSSSPGSTSNGARLTSTAAFSTRSGNRAAHAIACGPPPERPITEKVGMPNASAIAATSAAAWLTSRPSSRPEPP